MSIHEIFMPALSSTMTEGKIVSWEKSPGDKVEKGETVVVVESDKADMDVESFYEGYMAHIVVEAGNSAPVGSAIAFLAETEAEIETVRDKAKSSGGAPAKAEVAASTAPDKQHHKKQQLRRMTLLKMVRHAAAVEKLLPPALVN